MIIYNCNNVKQSFECPEDSFIVIAVYTTCTAFIFFATTKLFTRNLFFSKNALKLACSNREQ
jgi:hypothetical protein